MAATLQEGGRIRELIRGGIGVGRERLERGEGKKQKVGKEGEEEG